MKALSMKQIFQAIEKNNQLSDITLEANKNIRIYVDDELVFEGTSYSKYMKAIKEVYFDPFVALISNPLFTHNKNKFWDWDGREHEIEFFIYSV